MNADHQCLRTSILNLVEMIPVPEDVLKKVDDILIECIEKVEGS